MIIVKGTGASRGVARLAAMGRMTLDEVMMERVVNGTARIQVSACKRAATIVAAM